MTRAPTHVAKVEIRDLRGIEQVVLDLRDGFDQPMPVVVLLGSNGAGKTTVLEAILLALGQRELLPDDSASLDEQVRFGASDFHIALDLASPDGAALASFAVDRLSCEDDFEVDKGGARIPYSGHWETLRRLAPQVAYLPSRRDPEALGETPDPRGKRSRREARRLVEMKRALVGLYNRSMRARTPMSPLSPFMRLQEFWQNFAEDERELDVIAASENPADGDEVILREPRAVPDDITSLVKARLLAPERPDIPRMVPLDRLSDGQLSVLRFASVLLFNDRPLDLLVIDEPERHLHPHWHHRLLPALRALAPDTQIIVATHSPDIVTSVQSYERFTLGDPTRFEHKLTDAAE